MRESQYDIKADVDNSCIDAFKLSDEPLTPEEIAEGGAILAKYMGGEFHPKYTSQLYTDPVAFWVFPKDKLPIEHTGHLHGPDHLQYHSSWEWLMNVVQAIAEADNTIIEKKGPVYMEIDAMNIFSSKQKVFRAAVNFVKYINYLKGKK